MYGNTEGDNQMGKFFMGPWFFYGFLCPPPRIPTAWHAPSLKFLDLCSYRLTANKFSTIITQLCGNVTQCSVM